MFALIRLIAALGVLALRGLFPAAYPSLFLGVLFGHYALALWYSRRRAQEVLTARTSPAALFVLGLLCVLLPGAGGPALLLYFGLHHALTEGYMLATRRTDPRALGGAESRLLASRVALTLASYAVLLHASAPLSRLPLPVLHALLGVAVAAFVLCLVPVARRLPPGDLVDLLAFEAIGLCVCWLGQAARVSFHDAVFYHLIVWMMVPLRQLRGAAARLGYLAQTAAVSLFFFALMPHLGWFRHLTLPWWVGQSEFWGFFHITTSFSLSRFNPGFITRWFQPRPQAVVSS